jgi:hypothetical protein
MMPSSPAVGSGDPRPNIVSQRVLSSQDADMLLDLSVVFFTCVCVWGANKGI